MTLAVVTGAGSGIGRATALAFAQQGAQVAACDVDEARLASLKAELGARAAEIRHVDVSSRSEMQAFAEAVGTPDVVVNNAGVAVGGTFLDTSLDDWDWLLGINLKGVVHGCHFFAPKMVARGQGHLINIASIFGIYPAPNVTAYVASKFAVLGFSQSLRTELAPHGVKVTAICPGMINTQIVADGKMRGQTDSRRDKMAKTFATRGLAPAKVAAVILESTKSNPAVRTVGKDAWVMHQLTKLAPAATAKLGGAVARRMG